MFIEIRIIVKTIVASYLLHFLELLKLIKKIVGVAFVGLVLLGSDMSVLSSFARVIFPVYILKIKIFYILDQGKLIGLNLS